MQIREPHAAQIVGMEKEVFFYSGTLDVPELTFKELDDLTCFHTYICLPDKHERPKALVVRYIFVTRVAFGPFGLSPISNRTLSPT